MNYEQILWLFADKENFRMELRQPFKQQNMYVATDSHSLVWFPVTVGELPFKEQDKPAAWKVIPARTTNVEISITELKLQIEPYEIDGRIQMKCQSCDGKRTEECNLGHDHDCERCDRNGYIDKGLSGKKTFSKKVFIINGIAFLHEQLFRLIKACELMEVTTILRTAGTPNSGNSFEAGEAFILIMPCLQNDKENEITIKLN